MGLILKYNVAYEIDMESKDPSSHEIQCRFRRCFSVDTNPTYPMSLQVVHNVHSCLPMFLVHGKHVLMTSA